MAIIDRLLHHGEVFYLRGSSYRMRGKEAVAIPVAVSADPSTFKGRAEESLTEGQTAATPVG